MGGLSVRTKVFLLFAGAALLTVVPVLVLIGRAVEERVYARAEDELRRAADAVELNSLDSERSLRETARRIALERDVERLIREGDTRALARELVKEVEKGEIPIAVDSLGRSLVGPALDTAIVNRGGVVVVPADGDAPLRVAVWPVYRDTIRSAVDSLALPVLDSVQVGVVGVARRLNQQAVVALKTAAVGADVALVAGNPLRVVASTLPDSQTHFVTALTNLGDLTRRSTVETRAEEELMYMVLPLRATDAPAAIVLFRDVADELRLAQAIEQSVIGIGVVALVIALVLALLVARIVARPAQLLAAAAADLARGDFGARLPNASGDEIGQLTRAFREMRSAIAERETRLRSAQAELIHREKLAAMGRLVAQLSHEINNPIYNIQNCLEVLDRRSDPNDPNREFLELAREELQRMAVLTRQMLDQSRPLADAAAPINVNRLVQRVLTLAEPELESHGIRLERQLQPAVPLVVAHPDALQQVLANLVDNAIDAMPGGGSLRVTTRSEPEAGSVEVVVEDTGVGIAEKHLPHIFDAFYTTKPGVSGIGLGLFVSEGIIRGHRGRLLVESRVGEGSRFTVQLPRETLDAALAAETVPDAHAVA